MGDYMIIEPDELYHHGIKGQKWGIRRFQNRDGSYTSKGKDRASKKSEKSKESSKMAGKAFERNIKTKNGRISTAEDIGNNAKKINRGVLDLKRRSMEAKNRAELERIQNEAFSMSDKELQQRINRLQMEKRYTDLMQPQVDIGEDRVSRFLDTSLTVLEIAGATVAIAAGVQTLRKNSG